MRDYKILYKKISSDGAEELAKDLMQEEELDGLYSIKKITRIISYQVESHKRITHKDTNRIEEHIALKMARYPKPYSFIGDIRDFQIPLKTPKGNLDKNFAKEINKDVGKIDLFAYNKTEKIVTLLELKVKDSKEPLLRCVLEIFTYWKQLDHQKFLYDYNLPQDSVVKKAVFVFEGSSQYYVFD